MIYDALKRHGIDEEALNNLFKIDDNSDDSNQFDEFLKIYTQNESEELEYTDLARNSDKIIK